VQLYEAIITIWWKHLTDNNNQKKIKPLQSRTITLNEDDSPQRSRN
jgi:hypothetical protein